MRKTLDWFSTTHTPIFLRESYSSLVRNHCSLFSIPLHYHTLRGDLYPNTIHTFSECSEYFWSCWAALEEAKDGRCNMELVVGSGELDKTRFQEALLEQKLGGLRYREQIRLGGSLAHPCIPTDCLVDRLPLRGRRRGFSPSSSISSSITHWRVIYVCILLPYSFTFHFTAVIT